jgi:hypothetical protein
VNYPSSGNKIKKNVERGGKKIKRRENDGKV